MKQKTIKLLITTLTMIFISFGVIAEGFYVGFSTGQSSFNTGITNVAGSSLDEESSAHSFFIGKRINKILSLEGFYTDLGKVTLTANSGDTFNSPYGTITFGGSSNALETNSSTFGIAGKFDFINNEKSNFYLKAGLHNWETELKAKRGSFTLGSLKYDGTDKIVGLGSEYQISDNLSLIAGYDKYYLDKTDTTYLHIGTKYKF